MGICDGRVVIVTGSGRGLGRAHALAFAQAGAKVVVNDLGVAQDGSDPSDTPAQQVVDEIVAAGGEAITSSHDVADWDAAGEMVQSAIDAFGGLDVVVNNAGILRDAMSFSMSEAEWDDVVRVHLKGHAAMIHSAGAHWRRLAKAGTSPDERGGRIVNTASESGLYGLAGQINYAAAKAGIAAMTVVAARELRKYGVTVNAIAPRARTRMTEPVLGDLVAPEGTFDEWDPANIAPIVCWLASAEASDVTGQVFVVNGDKVHLMEGWTRVGRIDNGGQRFTLESLGAARGTLFGDRRPGLPPAGFGE